jgi:hypothetical protein
MKPEMSKYRLGFKRVPYAASAYQGPKMRDMYDQTTVAFGDGGDERWKHTRKITPSMNACVRQVGHAQFFCQYPNGIIFRIVMDVGIDDKIGPGMPWHFFHITCN